MTVFVILILFIFGLIIGSFLNVLIDRLPKDKDIVFERSHCDHCKTKLSPLDLIPIFSYFFLGGKCRYCRKKISIRNPIIEIISGLAFVILYRLIYPDLPMLIYQLAIVGLLIAVFAIDLKESIIPDKLVIFLVVLTLIFRLLFEPKGIIMDVLAGVSFAFFFIILILITRGRGMGLGDVKFAFFMGLYLGFIKLIAAFYLAFLTGAIVSLILVIGRRKTFKSAIPFGPFLVSAAIISQFYGLQILNYF